MSQSGPSHDGATTYNPIPLDDSVSTPANASFPNLPLPPTPPQHRFLGHDPNATRTSIASSGYQTNYDNSSAHFLYQDGKESYNDCNEKSSVAKSGAGKRKRNLIIGLTVAAVIVIAVAVAVPLAIMNKNKNSPNAASKSDSGTDGHGDGAGEPGKSGGALVAVTGGDGSDVTMEDGTTFKYSNPHGGSWYYDVNDPFNNGARAQSWSPALNETFRYGIDKIRGVNLGGWLVPEPFICPAVFEKYQPEALDEYTLHPAMAADATNGGANQLEDHYNTFITEKDFAEIAGAGLNYVRIPVPYWAVETRPNEPYISKVAWKYFLKAIQWARKYGIRINLDLHTVPGSQNVWNHSGRRGNINFLQGSMGYANAQRTLDVIRVIAEFISQPEYRDVVTMFGPINEPTIDQASISSFYAQAYKVIREASGPNEGPWISFHDAMLGKPQWAGFLPGADRIALDSHPYMAFSDVQTDVEWDSQTGTPCQWGREFNQSMADFGLSVAGEWSNAINDCGKWLNGIPEGTRYDGTYTAGKVTSVGSCDKWINWENFSDDTKVRLKTFALASMDGLQNWFFWTWKIGNSSISGKVEAPEWSYKLGLDNGWMPRDPREATGACGNPAPFTGTISSGTGDVDLTKYPWPPTEISGAGAPVSDLPQYTATGAIPTLTAATFPPSGVKPTKTVDVGNGWANPDDKTGMATEIAGCDYPDAWVNGTPVPSPWCASAKKRGHVDLAPPPPTPPPAP